MDSKEKTYVKAAIAGAVLLVVWLILRNRPHTVTGPAPTMNSFQAPYFTTNPGVSDNTSILNGGPTFQSTNTINVNTGTINGLSKLYMPMFGLVGMTGVQA